MYNMSILRNKNILANGNILNIVKCYTKFLF